MLMFRSSGVVLLLVVLGLLDGIITKAVVNIKDVHCKA